MMIKHAEQSKNNCEAARKYTVSQGKHLKVETTVTRTSKFYAKRFISMDSNTEQNMYHATSLVTGSNFKFSTRQCVKMMWRNSFYF
jgi:hypothetical protein